MTGDMGELFNAMREASKAKRASNRVNGPLMLQQAGIPFEYRNAGAHLIVGFQGDIYDYWPGTGLWRSRETGTQRRGAARLIARIQARQKSRKDSAKP